MAESELTAALKKAVDNYIHPGAYVSYPEKRTAFLNSIIEAAATAERCGITEKDIKLSGALMCKTIRGKEFLDALEKLDNAIFNGQSLNSESAMEISPRMKMSSR